MREVTFRTLAALWREVGRQAESDLQLEAMAEIVKTALGGSALALRRFDVEREGIETVASTGALKSLPPWEALGHDDLQVALAWARHGGAEVREGAGRRMLHLPLRDGERPVGVLLIDGRGDWPAPVRAAAAELTEPFVAALENGTRHHDLVRRREALEAERVALLSRLQRDEVADAVVGAERGLKGALELVRRVAPTDTPVLLIGETGSGKEVLAREIHRRSRRAKAPVVRVNCGAIPPGLVDTELFGHDRGSFTGATGTRLGWFERADGGTLFLDEIGELPPEAQVRLLRILQDGTFERVGGQRTRRVDVRVVAATHRDLREMVRAGEFREDLWYRIGVFPIEVPALRDRLEDLPELAAHFAWRSGVRLGGAPLNPTREELDLLLTYPWPGNVRELGAVIERAAILGDGHRLDIAGALGREPGSREMARPPGPAGTGTAITTLDDAIRAHIIRALGRTQGRIEGSGGAAELLGVNPHTLRGRMRKLGIRWREYRRR